MRLIASVFIILVVSCGPQHHNSDLSDDQKNKDIKEAKSLIQGIFDDVWGGLDSTRILDYHTDEFIILENGMVWKNKEIKDYIRRSLTNENRAKRINKMDYISSKHFGDAIYLDYHNYASFMQSDSIVGKAQWLESAIAVKTDKGWRLDKMHSTYVNTNK